MSSPGLSGLAQVALSAEREAELGRLADSALGPRSWCARMLVEARELLALEALGERVRVEALEVSSELHAAVRLRAPVACLSAEGELAIHDQAALVLRYPQEILRRPLPGTALVTLLRPGRVWHPNIERPAEEGPPRGQRVCLGASVPRGLPLREALVGTYTALALQLLSLDERDPAGILNPEALTYWRERRARLPLSAEPFLTGGAA